MPADVTALNAAIASLTEEVAATEGVTASAITLIQGFAASVQAAVDAALLADNAADAGSITAANDAIATVLGRFVANRAALGAAVAAVPVP